MNLLKTFLGLSFKTVFSDMWPILIEDRVVAGKPQSVWSASTDSLELSEIHHVGDGSRMWPNHIPRWALVCVLDYKRLICVILRGDFLTRTVLTFCICAARWFTWHRWILIVWTYGSRLILLKMHWLHPSFLIIEATSHFMVYPVTASVAVYSFWMVLSAFQDWQIGWCCCVSDRVVVSRKWRWYTSPWLVILIVKFCRCPWYHKRSNLGKLEKSN